MQLIYLSASKLMQNSWIRYSFENRGMGYATIQKTEENENAIPQEIHEARGTGLMNSPGNHIEQVILEKAKEFGASLAGIARIADLKASPSYKAYARKPFYEEYELDHPNYFKFTGVEWKKEHKSVLVWALEHPESEPALDWWSMKVPGFTPGNRIMRSQSKQLRIWMGEELGIQALSLPYQIEYGGVFF